MFSNLKRRLNPKLLSEELAQQALRQSEERFSKAFHANPASTSITTLDGYYLDVNKSFLELWGYERMEVIGRSASELHIWVDPGVRARAIARLQAEQQVQRFEAQLRRKNGEIRDVHISMDLITLQGRTCVLTLTEDITERKRAEQALRASEARYRAISELVSDFAYAMRVDSEGKTELEWATDALRRITGYTLEELEARGGWPSLVHPQDRARAAEHLNRLVAGTPDVCEVRVITRDGRVRWLRLRGRPVPGPDSRIVRIYGAAQEVTEQVQAYQLLEQRVEERTRELSSLLQVARKMSSTLELEPLLNLILDQLQTMVDYTGAAILVAEGDDLVFLEYRGPMPREEVMRLRIPHHRFPGYIEVMERREPIIIGDIWGDSKLAKSLLTANQQYSVTFGYAHAWLGVPLLLRERVLGMLRLDHRAPNHFTPQHAKLALAIADQAAIAIENARLYKRAQEVALIEERQRLARELHDSIQQALYGIRLGARTARERLARDPASLAEPLDYLSTLADAGLAEMRELIFDLRPESLAREGLAAGLAKQVASLRARHNLEVTDEICAEPDIPLEAKEALYRITREALNNVVRHANATHVNLMLCAEEGALTLEIRDDGVGFDPSRQFPGHLGLQSMAERARLIGAKLEIESAPGRGTTVRVRWS